MAENTKNVEFKNPHPELPVREPILKLGKMVTDRAAIKLGLEKLTADDPEYWGLAAICTDEMAEVAVPLPSIMHARTAIHTHLVIYLLLASFLSSSFLFCILRSYLVTTFSDAALLFAIMSSLFISINFFNSVQLLHPLM